MHFRLADVRVEAGIGVLVLRASHLRPRERYPEAFEDVASGGRLKA